ISSITTLTGSALLALALAHSAIEPEAAWLAAHVDEDWQMSQWGHDELALERRAHRHGEFQAAVTVLKLASPARPADLIPSPIALAAGIIKKPDAPFCLIYVDLDLAGGGHVAVLFADVMSLAHRRDEALVVVPQLGQHILGIDIGRIVIGDALMARYVADRSQRGAAQLADAFGKHVGHCEDLIGLFVKQEVIVAEV